ncbi:hypothetical protein CR513_45079, partial [Mucuna pruriens]
MLQSMQNPNRNAPEQSQVTLDHHPRFTPNQPQNQTQYPMYGLLLGYTPPVNNNSNPHAATSNPKNQVQPQITFIPPPTHDTPNLKFINPTPIVVLHPHQSVDPYSTKMLQLFKERLKAIKGANYFDFNMADLCLILGVVIPPKFKLLEFDKYKGNTCPKNYLTIWPHMLMMKNCSSTFSKKALWGPLSGGYMSLELGCIEIQRDLAKTFLKQYKYNMDMAPDCTELQNMAKKEMKPSRGMLNVGGK